MASTQPSNALERVWQSAQSRIYSQSHLPNDSCSSSPRVIRVGQLDSEILDNDLANLLREPLSKALGLINAALRAKFDLELSLLIQLVLYRLSIWNTGASYGAQLQDLRYVTSQPATGPLTPSGLPRRLLVVHGTLTTIIPYLHTRIRNHALSRAWPDAPSSDRRRQLWGFITSLESTHTLLSLASFVAFLWNGRYRTIADRVLGLSLIPSRRLVRRDVSYEFMNRQMVWHAFTEFLLFLLPLVNARTVRRRMNRITSALSLTSIVSRLPEGTRTHLGLDKLNTSSQSPTHQRGKYWHLPLDQCAICAENASLNLNLSEQTNALTILTRDYTAPSTDEPPDNTPNSANEPPTYPIYTPYLSSCGHLYCYHCITERMIRALDETGEGGCWECLRCCQHVKFADRYVVDMGSDRATSDYEFSSDMEATDMEASVGSYSEFSQLSDN